jgi:RES domain-containing protein
MDRNLAVAVSKAGVTEVEGIFERHVSPQIRTLTGSSAGGRWGPPGAYSTLYLGRPTESVVGEAYRHLVDEVEGMRPELVGPRRLLVCEVRVSNVLDLRDSKNQELVGLDIQALLGDHAPCQRVGSAAHQLSLHGVIAPAATGLGETLALFESHLPEEELPTLIESTIWESLPADPRQSSVQRQES